MKKLLSLALTAVLVTALSIPVAADTPTAGKTAAPAAVNFKMTTVSMAKAELPASTVLSGKVDEIKEHRLLFTTAEGVQYTVPLMGLAENENYKKMSLQAGDQIEVTGHTAIAAMALSVESKEESSGSVSMFNELTADTVTISLSKAEPADAEKLMGTISISDKGLTTNKSLSFVKVDDSYIITDENGETVTVNTTMPAAEAVSIQEAPAFEIMASDSAINILIPEKLTAKGITAEIK